MRDSFSKYKRVYRYVWQTYGQSWPYRISIVLQMIKNGVKFVALPITLSYMLAAISKQDYDMAIYFAALFGLGSLSIGAVAPFVKYIGMLGENVIYRQETGRYFERLLVADVEYFNSNLSGYLTAATRQFVDGGVRFARAFRDAYLQTIMSFVLPVIVIASTNWVLGVIMLVLSILQFIYLVWASQVIEPYRSQSREIYRKNSGTMADAIMNILAVKSAAREKSIVQTVRENAEKEGQVFRKRYSLRAKLTAGREVVTVTTYVILLIVIITLAKSGALSLAGAILVATYINPILTSIYLLSEQLDEHDDMIDQLIPGFDLAEMEHKIADPESPVPLKRPEGAIVFEDVTFSYDGSKDVLRSFNLRIPAGQKVGVVGASGEGKSTLTKLLLRFNDVDSGSVTVDGIDVREVQQEALRRNVAYVPQEPLLFHSSIEKNILFSRPDATKEEVLRAIKNAHARDFILSLPQGVDSVVGERGVKLSGGQKQRIAIARAVLQDAPIMILDEATSALDSESEMIIRRSFRDILKGKTAIVVAHRLSTLSDMDRIVVLRDGVIIEDGTHDELLAIDGEYARLWKRQQRLESSL